MIRENLYEPFSITFKTTDECLKQEHRHNFFELVYICAGTGRQCINQNSFDYGPGHLFLITPEDCHSFDITTTTSFFFLRFNNIYLKDKGPQRQHIERLEFILQHANHRPGCILKHRSDKGLVQPVVEAILREYEEKDLYNKELVQQLVNTLIVVVARNIARQLPEQVHPGTEEKAQDILRYVQSNICYPEKLKAATISGHFGISEAYLGRYFKKHTRETLQQYIHLYRTRLIEHRLQYSDKRMSEIAGEFGFTDLSHFNKFFRKQHGISPKAYREAAREA